MPIKDRDLLFKIHQAVVKQATPPATTFAPQTGEVNKPEDLTPKYIPIPLPVIRKD